MERLIYELREIENHETHDMTYFLNFLSVFFTSINLCFAFITLENINVVTGLLGLGFLLLRNVPFMFVRFWELFLFVKSKKTRSRILAIWRDVANKKLNDEESTDKTEKKDQANER